MKGIILFIYFCLVLIMGIATFLEHSQGTPFVVRNIYHSPVFLSVWALLPVLTLIVLHRLRMWRKPFVWMLHLSFIVILVGAGVSFLTGRKGQLYLRMNVPAFRYMEQETQVMKDMLFLGIGIFLGAMWANVSWGRYWAWDPKEVWTLITFMLYGVALHGDSLSWLNRSRTFHVYLLCSFLAVLMTYFGVNFLLGGMHSYA